MMTYYDIIYHKHKFDIKEDLLEIIITDLVCQSLACNGDDKPP